MAKLNRKTKKRSNVYYFINNLCKRFKQKKELTYWLKNGQPLPPPHIVKQKILLDYASNNNLKILVETGTYYGDMVQAMKGVFEKIYSIELSEILADVATWRFKDQSHVEIIQGDSGFALGRLMDKLDAPVLFWLDGHYSAGVTARGEKETPIYEELTHIYNRGDLNDVIIIDDARSFGSDPGYPTIEELKGFVLQKWPDCSFTVADDAIRIVCQNR